MDHRIGDSIQIDGVNYLIEPGDGLSGAPMLRITERRIAFNSVRKGRVEVSVGEVLRVLVSNWEDFKFGYHGTHGQEARVMGMPIPVIAAFYAEWRSRNTSGVDTPLTPADVHRVFGDKS